VKREITTGFFLALALASWTVLVSGQDKKPQSPGGIDWCANSWGRQEDKKLLMNLPSSPLTLNLSESKRDLLLGNGSNKRVVKYRLGEVAQKKDKLVVVHRSEPITIDLSANETLINPSEVEQELKFSLRKKTKLAVVEVTFSDGTVWQAMI
jgi:hypothetical protein